MEETQRFYAVNKCRVRIDDRNYRHAARQPHTLFLGTLSEVRSYVGGLNSEAVATEVKNRESVVSLVEGNLRRAQHRSNYYRDMPPSERLELGVPPQVHLDRDVKTCELALKDARTELDKIKKTDPADWSPTGDWELYYEYGSLEEMFSNGANFDLDEVPKKLK